MATALDRPSRDLILITRLDQVPVFCREADEADFWDTHEMSEELWATLPRVPDEELPPARQNPVSVRFDPDTLFRLKSLARKKHKGYQTLLKEFVMERLYEEEKREGILSPAEPPTSPARTTPRRR